MINLIHPIQLKHITLPGNIFSAPLAGYTNILLLDLFHKYGADVLYTEMYNVNEIVKRPYTDLPLYKTPYPLVIQLFGSSRDNFLDAAQKIQPIADCIDINFACPIKKIVKANGGAAWLQDLDAVYKLSNQLTRLPIDITAKVRLGYSNNSILKIVNTLYLAGISLITVHVRTAAMLFAGTPLYDAFLEIADMPIPKIINGNITNPEIALQCLQNYKADGIMIGRGALSDFALFSRIKDFFVKGTFAVQNNNEKILQLLEYYSNFEKLNFSKYMKFVQTRKLAHYVIKGLPFSRTIREFINKASSAQEIIDYLTQSKL